MNGIPTANADTRLWLLADVLVCPNGHRMIPARREHRQYRCPDPVCRRRVDAELAETVVWEQVTRLRPWLVPSTTPAGDRAAMLRSVLARVRVTPGRPSFRLTWQLHARSAIPASDAERHHRNTS